MYFVYTIFILFVLNLLTIIFYIIRTKIYDGTEKKRIEKVMEKLKAKVAEHLKLENFNEIPEKDISYIKKLVLTKTGLLVFNRIYSDYINTYGYDERIKSYAALIIDYNILLKNRIVRDKYRRSYILHLLAGYRINSPKVIEFALESLESNSHYVRNNALRVIGNSGNVESFLEAYKIISFSDKYFNNKMILDLIDSFKGDKQSLNHALDNEFDSFSVEIQKVIIEHFTNVKYSGAVKRLLDVLENTSNIELKIAATKYFSSVISSKSYPLILGNADSDEWELRAVTVKVLEKYNKPETIDKLIESISDQNWFVRYNAALSLISLDTDNVTIKKIFKFDDRYAKEITLYAMFTKSLIDFEEYKKLLNIQTGKEVNTA